MKAFSHYLILLTLLLSMNFKWIGEGIPGELWLQGFWEESLVHTEVAQRLSFSLVQAQPSGRDIRQ